MYDIIALGESLIDFTPAGFNDMGMSLFSQNPGGAPANVLAMAAKLGGKTAFIGKVGDDVFGQFLIDNLKSAQIDTSNTVKDKSTPTTLAFVQLNENGDRSFSFYRNPGADIMLCNSEVSQDLLKDCKVFHFGSVSLTNEPCRSATLFAAQLAKKSGALISFDPNYRPFLWESEEKARLEILSALPLSDLLKISEEEMVMLTNMQDIMKGAKKLLLAGLTAVFVTLGKNGAFVLTKTAHAHMNTYDVKTIDTTGAGDAFWGSMLLKISGMTLDEINKLTNADWTEYIKFSNAAGSLTTTHNGAIPAMPNKHEITTCMKETSLLK